MLFTSVPSTKIGSAINMVETQFKTILTISHKKEENLTSRTRIFFKLENINLIVGFLVLICVDEMQEPLKALFCVRKFVL